jgi:hypothetical protein
MRPHALKATALVPFALFAVAAPAGASIVSQPVSGHAIQAFAVETTSGFLPRVVSRNYDNWTNPGSLLTSVFTAGANEIADDLNMTPPAGVGLLSTMGINVANSNSPTGTALTGGSVLVRFYDMGNANAFIFGFTANLPALNLAAGGSSRLQFAAAALEGFNVFLPQNILCSLQWNTATFSGTGASIANLGFQTRGPINIGASTDNLFNVTGGGTPFNFNGAPLANTGIFIDTNSVPAPASAALLGLGGLIAARRRRS